MLLANEDRPEIMKKSVFRRECLARLRYIQKHAYHKRDYLINKALYDLIRKENAQSILLYIPLKIEVDIHPLIRVLRRQNRTLLVHFAVLLKCSIASVIQILDDFEDP